MTHKNWFRTGFCFAFSFFKGFLILSLAMASVATAALDKKIDKKEYARRVEALLQKRNLYEDIYKAVMREDLVFLRAQATSSDIFKDVGALFVAQQKWIQEDVEQEDVEYVAQPSTPSSRQAARQTARTRWGVDDKKVPYYTHLSPLALAIKRDSLKVAEILLQYQDIAPHKMHVSVVEPKHQGRSAYHMALARGQTKFVELMIKHVPDPKKVFYYSGAFDFLNAHPVSKATPLTAALWCSASQSIGFECDTLDYVFDSGLVTITQNIRLKPPFYKTWVDSINYVTGAREGFDFFPSYWQSQEIAQMQLMPTLHHIAYSPELRQNKRIELVDYLISKGANIEQRDFYGRNIIMNLVRYKGYRAPITRDSMYIAMDHPYLMTTARNLFKKIQGSFIERIMGHKNNFDINATDFYGLTVMHHVVGRSYNDISPAQRKLAEFFIQQGAEKDVDATIAFYEGRVVDRDNDYLQPKVRLQNKDFKKLTPYEMNTYFLDQIQKERAKLDAEQERFDAIKRAKLQHAYEQRQMLSSILKEDT